MISRAMRRLLLALLILSGCVPYVPRPVDPAANARAIESRRLDDPALHSYAAASLGRPIAEWPPAAWDLDSLTAAAFYFNPDIAVARAEHATAMAAIITARQLPNPTAGISLEHKAPTPELKPWVSSFGFDVPLELPAKRRARTDQAVAAAEALRSRIGAVAWGIRSRLRSDLLDLYAAQERQAALTRELEIERDIVEIFTKRLQYGEAAQPELARARIAMGQTTLLIEDTRRLAAEGRAGAAGAVGVGLAAFGDNAIDIHGFGGAAPPIDLSLRDLALTGRADVLASLHQYAASEAGLRLEVMRQVPDLHLGPAFGWDQGARTWALAASAELPVLNRHRGEIGEAAARRDEAAARFTALQVSILAAFDLARAQLGAAERKLAEAEALVRSEEAQVSTAQKQFEVGEIDRLALRSAELEREAAALARVDASVDVQRAVGAVEDSLQRPLGAAMPQLEAKQ
jgi:outer membrane protein, heavy metal efflux system